MRSDTSRADASALAAMVSGKGKQNSAPERDRQNDEGAAWGMTRQPSPCLIPQAHSGLERLIAETCRIIDGLRTAAQQRSDLVHDGRDDFGELPPQRGNPGGGLPSGRSSQAPEFVFDTLEVILDGSYGRVAVKHGATPNFSHSRTSQAVPDSLRFEHATQKFQKRSPVAPMSTCGATCEPVFDLCFCRVGSRCECRNSRAASASAFMRVFDALRGEVARASARPHQLRSTSQYAPALRSAAHNFAAAA